MQTEQNLDGAITFRSVVNKTTRVSTVTSTNELTSFFVLAGTHANGAKATTLDFMSTPVYREGAGWTYAPTMYYPSNGDEVDFYAYAPIKPINTGNIIIDVDGKTKFFYHIEKNQKEDNPVVDLLVASVTDKTDDGSAVELTFNHALSAVTFSAANRNAPTSELTYVISDIKLIELESYAMFAYPLSEDSWSEQLGSKGDYIAGIPEAGVALEAIGDDPAQKLLSNNDVLIVLPQNVQVATFDTDGNVISGKSYVEVTYSLKDGEGAPIYTDAVRKLALPADFKFVPGQLYNFEFEFGGTSGAGANAITFTVTTVNGWSGASQTLPE